MRRPSQTSTGVDGQVVATPRTRNDASTAKGRRGRPPAGEITEPQLRALSAVRSLTMLRGRPPTLREVGEELGITAAGAGARVSQLIRRGCLRREPHKARSLQVIAAPRDDSECVVPLKVVADVAAKRPILSAENAVGEILAEARLVRQGPCFVLKAKDDSMSGVGIEDGGYCIVRMQPAAESGDVVAAVLGGRGIVRRLRILDTGVELRSENPRHASITVRPDDDFRIVGKVVAIQAQAASGDRR